MIIQRQKNFSSKEQAKGPKFIPGLHFDGRDGKGNRISTPAYIDENGEMKELTEEIWNKYHGKSKKFSMLDRALDLQQAELDRQSNLIGIRRKLLKGEIGLKDAGKMAVDNNVGTVKKRINIISGK